MELYNEGLCTFEYRDQLYNTQGAVITSERIVAYLQNGGLVTSWYGEILGTYHVTARWKTPRSWISNEMWQITACIKVSETTYSYTGRSAGIGMIFKGRLKRGTSRKSK